MPVAGSWKKLLSIVAAFQANRDCVVRWVFHAIETGAFDNQQQKESSAEAALWSRTSADAQTGPHHKKAPGSEAPTLTSRLDRKPEETEVSTSHIAPNPTDQA